MNPAHSSTPIRSLAVLLTALLAYSVTAVAQPVASATTRQVSVSGEAERRVAPDMAILSMDVVTENSDVAIARREADAITAEALRILRGARIDDSDIDTTGLSIAPQYRWLKDAQEQQLTGYRITRSIEVRLLELERLGEIVTKLSDSGINRMQPPRLGLQNEETVYRAVLAEAATSARERAEVVAAALGEKLGAVLSLNTHRDPSPRPMGNERAMLAADASAGGAESYSSSYLTYRVSVSATFSID